MTETAFLTPKLHGGRFEKHAVPLEFLKDLNALQAMVFAVAKQKFRDSNPDRQRLVKGFSSGIELGLSSIETGSVKLVLNLLCAGATLFPSHPSLPFFEEAGEAIVEVIEAAENGQTAPDDFPSEALRIFDRLGKGLKDGETFQLSSPRTGRVGSLTRDVRRKILLSIPEVYDYEEETVLRGSVSGVNWDEQTIQLNMPDGQMFQFHYSGPEQTEFVNEIISAKSKLEQGKSIKLLLAGTGKFSRQGKLLNFISVEEISFLDPLDIDFRLDELRQLQNGWMDGEGGKLSESGLDWLKTCFDRYFNLGVPIPYIYPRVDGGLSIEWTFPHHEISMEVDLDNKTGYWVALHSKGGEAEDRELNLETEEGWKWIVEQVTTKGETTP